MKVRELIEFNEVGNILQASDRFTKKREKHQAVKDEDRKYDILKSLGDAIDELQYNVRQFGYKSVLDVANFLINLVPFYLRGGPKKSDKLLIMDLKNSLEKYPGKEKTLRTILSDNNLINNLDKTIHYYKQAKEQGYDVGKIDNIANGLYTFQNLLKKLSQVYRNG